MTRINTVPPRVLSDSHLLVEIQEIPRVPNLVLKKLRTGRPIASTGHYKLGGGHVVFFYDKIAHLHRRLEELCVEADKRGFDDKRRPDDGRWAECQTYPQCWNDWQPDYDAVQENLSRLIDKIKNSTVEPKYYRKPVTRIQFINETLTK